MRRLEWMGAEPADRCCNELPTAKNAADDKATSTTVIIEPMPLSSTASAARLLTHSARGAGVDDTPVPAFASVSHLITTNACRPRVLSAAATRPLPAGSIYQPDLDTERSHRRPFQCGQDLTPVEAEAAHHQTSATVGASNQNLSGHTGVQSALCRYGRLKWRAVRWTVPRSLRR